MVTPCQHLCDPPRAWIPVEVLSYANRLNCFRKKLPLHLHNSGCSSDLQFNHCTHLKWPLESLCKHWSLFQHVMEEIKDSIRKRFCLLLFFSSMDLLTYKQTALWVWAQTGRFKKNHYKMIDLYCWEKVQKQEEFKHAYIQYSFVLYNKKRCWYFYFNKVKNTSPTLFLFPHTHFSSRIGLWTQQRR